MKHRYLFILEIAPVEAGKAYEELPSHLTLMSRFFSGLSPERMNEVVRPLFSQTAPIKLTFRETTELGPKKLTVHMIEHNQELKQLHNKLRTLLDLTNAEYEYPQFIGKNHKPHVTMRAGVQFDAGEEIAVKAAYLIEIMDGKRVVRYGFDLYGNAVRSGIGSFSAVPGRSTRDY